MPKLNFESKRDINPEKNSSNFQPVVKNLFNPQLKEVVNGHKDILMKLILIFVVKKDLKINHIV